MKRWIALVLLVGLAIVVDVTPRADSPPILSDLAIQVSDDQVILEAWGNPIVIKISPITTDEMSGIVAIGFIVMVITCVFVIMQMIFTPAQWREPARDGPSFAN